MGGKCHDGKAHHHHGETMAVVQLAPMAAGSESLLATCTNIIRLNTLPCLCLPHRDVLAAERGQSYTVDVVRPLIWA
jgi:hypothetical protein